MIESTTNEETGDVAQRRDAVAERLLRATFGHYLNATADGVTVWAMVDRVKRRMDVDRAALDAIAGMYDAAGGTPAQRAGAAAESGVRPSGRSWRDAAGCAPRPSGREGASVAEAVDRARAVPVPELDQDVERARAEIAAGLPPPHAGEPAPLTAYEAAAAREKSISLQGSADAAGDGRAKARAWLAAALPPGTTRSVDDLRAHAERDGVAWLWVVQVGTAHGGVSFPNNGDDWHMGEPDADAGAAASRLARSREAEAAVFQSRLRPGPFRSSLLGSMAQALAAPRVDATSGRTWAAFRIVGESFVVEHVVTPPRGHAADPFGGGTPGVERYDLRHGTEFHHERGMAPLATFAPAELYPPQAAVVTDSPPPADDPFGDPAAMTEVDPDRAADEGAAEAWLAAKLAGGGRYVSELEREAAADAIRWADVWNAADRAGHNPRVNVGMWGKYPPVPATLTADFYDRPCAGPGLVSYRYKGPTGYVMIGAKDDADAMREASRSVDNCTADHLQVWDGARYVAIAPDQTPAPTVPHPAPPSPTLPAEPPPAAPAGDPVAFLMDALTPGQRVPVDDLKAASAAMGVSWVSVMVAHQKAGVKVYADGWERTAAAAAPGVAPAASPKRGSGKTPPAATDAPAAAADAPADPSEEWVVATAVGMRPEGMTEADATAFVRRRLKLDAPPWAKAKPVDKTRIVQGIVRRQWPKWEGAAPPAAAS